MLTLERIIVCLHLLCAACVCDKVLRVEYFVDQDNGSVDKFVSDQNPFRVRNSNSSCDLGHFPHIPVCFVRGNFRMATIPPLDCRFVESNMKIMFCQSERPDFEWTRSELDFLQLDNFVHLRNLPNISNVFAKYIRINSENLEYIHTGGASDRLLVLELKGGNLFEGTGTPTLFWEAFEGFPRLVRLKMNNNNLNLTGVIDVPDRPLLTNLELLSFADNSNLETLNNEIFYPLRKSPLKELNLRNCRIQKIGLLTFFYLPNLTHVDLHGNKELFTLSAKYPFCLTMVPILHKMKFLGLSSVNLLIYPQCMVWALKWNKMEVLNLSNNIYNGLGFVLNKFKSVSHLQVLIIDNSEIRHIKNDALRHFGSSLRTLSLRYNHINRFWPGLVISSLQYLDLSYQREVSGQSPEFTIPSQVFAHNRMASLRVLKLRGLRKNAIHIHNFKGLNQLTELDLGDSFIETIDELAFSPLKSLQTLILSNCQRIQSLHRHVFFGLSELRYLDISNTKIIVPKFNIMLPVFDIQLQFLNLSNSLRGLQDISIEPNLSALWLDLPNLKVLDLSHNRVIPWKKPILRNNKLLKYFYLRDNDITYLSPGMLQDFYSLTLIDLSENYALTCGLDVATFHELTLKHSNMQVIDYKNGSGLFCHIPRNDNQDKFVSFKSLYENYTDFFPPEEEVEETMVKSNFTWFVFFVATVSLTVCAFYVYSNRFFIYYRWKTLRCNSELKKKGIEDDSHSSYLYDVFISYCEKDRDWVFSELIPHLEEDFRVCVHERDFKVGMMVVDNIINCIDKSRRFIAILSPSFVKSQWCAFETHVAHMRMNKSNEQFLVVVKDKVSKKSLDKGLNFIMKTWTYIIWPSVYSKKERFIFWNRIREGIL